MIDKAKAAKIAAFSSVVVLLVAGAAYAGYQRSTVPAQGAEGNSVSVARGTIQSSVPADGRVVAQEWDLSFGANGTVDSVDVAEGDPVTAGQVLATLRTDKADAQVSQARSALSAAEAKLAAVNEQPRSEDVAAKAALVDAAESSVRSAQDAYDVLVTESAESTVSASELQSKEAALSSATSQLKVAEANLAAAKAPASASDVAAAQAGVEQASGALQAAKDGLTDYELVAPSDGVVVSLALSPGQVLDAAGGQEPAMVIADLTELRIEGALDEMDASTASAGMPAEILIDALDGQVAPGTVDYVAPTAQVDANGLATFLVRVSTDSPVERLAPGMAVRIQVITDRVADVLTIPTSTVSRKDGASTVIVVGSDGTSRQTEVVLGKTDGKVVEVVSGLEEGARVALPGDGGSEQ